MIVRRKPRHSSMPVEVTPIVHLWLLRLRVPLGGNREFITARGFKNDSLAEAIGLGHWVDPESFDFDLDAVRAELRKDSRPARRTWHGRGDRAVDRQHPAGTGPRHHPQRRQRAPA